VGLQHAHQRFGPVHLIAGHGAVSLFDPVFGGPARVAIPYDMLYTAQNNLQNSS